MARQITISKIQTGNADLDRVQEHLREKLNPVLASLPSAADFRWMQVNGADQTVPDTWALQFRTTGTTWTTIASFTSNGLLAQPNPMLGANTAAGQSITNSGAAVIVVFGTVERDTDTAYNSSTGRYTVPTGKAGDYEITGTIAWSAAATGAFVQVFKNAALLKTIAYTGAAGVAAAGSTQGGSTTVNLAAGDIIDIRVGHTSGGAVTLSANADRNFFALKRVS